MSYNDLREWIRLGISAGPLPEALIRRGRAWGSPASCAAECDGGPAAPLCPWELC
jgi:hypothetical protein